MNKTEMKKAAQDVIVQHMAAVTGSDDFEAFAEEVADRNMAEAIIKAQMDRVAKMFGYKEAWFG